MKKLTILICVLAILLSLTGVASASPAEPRKFRIEGKTTFFELMGPIEDTESSCKVMVSSAGDVIRDIQGVFQKTEFLYYFGIDCTTLFAVFGTDAMPLPDYNDGTLTISNGSTVDIGFMGLAGEETVRGAFWVNSGTASYEDLAGGGTYKGIPDTCTITIIQEPPFFELDCTGFYVDFAGRFDTEEGKKVFDGHKKAVKELMKILDNKDAGESAKVAAMTAITSLLDSDAVLASTAIEEAQGAGGDAREIAKAEKEMTKAQDEIDKGKYDKAIDHYKKAWEHAQKAIKKAS